MTRRSARLGSFLLATLALAACSDQATPPSMAPAAMTSAAQLEMTSSVDEIAPDRNALGLPTLELFDDQTTTDLVQRAINPSDYVCSTASPVNAWINAEVNKSLAVEPTLFLTAYSYLADLIPTYEAIYFQSSATPQYFGVNGEHTHAIVKAERDLKNFWDIESSNIQVLGMHGSVLLDTLRTAATYRLFGYSVTASKNYARIMRNAILPSQTMVGGNHPYFTFNAVAASGSIGDKIVMGDGILAVYDALGFSDVAPQAIFAHEFAHQVQFDKKYVIAGNPAEKTRFAELNADALAAYYLTHSRGATMNRKRVEQFLEIFYQIGDCSFTSSGHHGTPNQRRKSATLGFDIADEAQKQGHIMTADQVHARFMAAYPTIIAPDKP